MAAELKIVVTGYDAALAKLTTLSKGYDDLAKKAVETQKKASKTRLSIIADEVQQARSLYKSVKPTSGSGRVAGGRAGPSGGMSEGGFGSSISGGIAAGAAMGAVGIAAGALKGALDMAVDGLKSFGSFLLNDVFKPQMRLEKAAVQLENASGGQIKASVVMSRANAAQLKWNIEANDAAAVMADLMDQTGRTDLAFDKFDDLAKLSKAYGGEAKEYASVVAAIASYDPKASADAILEMVKQISAAGQVTGGKFTGSVQARAGGAQFGALPFIAGANVAEKVATSNALMQFGGIQGKYEETITAQFALISDAIRLNKQGVLQQPGMLTKEGTLNTESMIEAIMRKTVVKDQRGVATSKADIVKTIGLSEPAQKMAGQMQMRFASILESNGGKVDDAIKEILKSFRAFKDAKIDEKKLSEDAARTMQTTAEKWETAVNTVKGELIKLYPKFQELVDKITSNVPAITQALRALADVLLDAATSIANWFGDDRTIRQIEQTNEVRDITRRIELAEGDGKTLEADQLKQYRKEVIARQQRENVTIEKIAASKGGVTKEEKEENYEEALEMVTDVKTTIPTLRPGDSTIEETIRANQENGTYTEAEAKLLLSWVDAEKKKAEEASARQESGTAEAKGFGNDLSGSLFASERKALSDELSDLTDSLEKYTTKVKNAADKIPTGPMGGGANGGTK